MFDQIEKLGRSTIQHGRNNNRVYLMKLDAQDVPNIIDQLDALAQSKGYTKVFAKVPDLATETFLNEGYQQEARIPGFKKGLQGVSLLAKYLTDERGKLSPEKQSALDQKMRLVQEKARRPAKKGLPDGFRIMRLTENDAAKLAEVYRKVFDVYPFPIFEPEYLSKTMQEHIRYYGVFDGDKLVAAASSEMDEADLNSEMTDFATLPEYLGLNLSYFLLEAMEKDMRTLGLKTLYTIARAESVGMNTTFARMGYEFAGRLINNTMISTQIESMNVWYKSI